MKAKASDSKKPIAIQDAPKGRPTAITSVIKPKAAAPATKLRKSPRKDRPAVRQPIVATPTTTDQGSKQARLVALLQTKTGATIDQMRELTGWQAHTVRGTISGVLRKKLGLHVTCEQASATAPRLYRIVGVSA